MKFNSLWDRLMFPFRMKKLIHKTNEDYIRSLECSNRFWQDEALRWMKLYKEVKK